jgi:hypothetical protein
VVIDDEKRTAFPGAATVLEIEFRVTNHDPVPHRLRKSIRGLNRGSFPSLGDQDLVAAEREAQAIRERRHQQGDGLPGRVQPGETVYGVYVTTFPWDPTGTFPDYTLIIKDERHAYTTRPHGADADPLAACRSPAASDYSPWRPGSPVMAQCKLGRPAMGSDGGFEEWPPRSSLSVVGLRPRRRSPASQVRPAPAASHLPARH